MIKKNIGGLPALQATHLAQMNHLMHAFFLRHGGVSIAPYDTLNVGENIGDSRDDVSQNIERIQTATGVTELAKLNQIHGKKVHAVSKGGDYEGDALITQTKNLLLLVRHADCQPALFYDPVTQTIGAVHAGWKGLVCNIYEETLHAMRAAYDVHPENVYVGIGPSLGPCHAEFTNYQKEFPQEFSSFKKKNDFFDLWEIAKHQLLDAGIQEKHIEICPVCTFDEKRDCFSYRRDGVTGRHGSVIALKAEKSV